MTLLASNGWSLVMWLQNYKTKEYEVREWLVKKADRAGLSEFLAVKHEFHNMDPIALSRIEDFRAEEKHGEVRQDLQGLKPAVWWKDKKTYWNAAIGAVLALLIKKLTSP